MKDQNNVLINGISYDPHTGMAVQQGAVTASVTADRARPAHAKGVHQRVQKSQTLNRQFVTAPAAKAAPKAQRSGTMMDIGRPRTTRSPHITRFAPSATPSVTSQVAEPADTPATTHPIVAKAVRPAVVAKPAAHPTAAALKVSAVEKALDQAKTNHEDHPKEVSHKTRTFSIVGASLAMLLLAGYFTYLNMPSLSVRVAAAQANIAASFPEYQPNGFSLAGPVSFSPGEVEMEFQSNSNQQGFKLAQASTAWDSSALLEKYVKPKSDGNYATYSDSGLTIYTFGNSAAWVNGGILYTVDGSASLSSEQIRRIASSL